MAGNEKIRMAHGSGGRLSRELVRNVFMRHFAGKELSRMDDAAALVLSSNRLAFTTDAYVVSPLFFPGGDIGRIAVCGTVNDLAVKGAVPRWISAAFVLEEGLGLDVLGRICASMRAAAREAGVEIVAGDTKVVEKGKADGIFITTAGVGELRRNLSSDSIKPGDAVIVSGRIGEHGVAVLNARHQLGLKSGIKSDAAPLNGLVRAVLAASPCVHAMRDLTRGGLAGALVEMAESSSVRIEVDSAFVPVSEAVKSASGLLGLDPMYSANEGKLVCFVPEKDSRRILSAMRGHSYGRAAAVIGRVSGKIRGGAVMLKTGVGGSRRLLLAEGEQLPRIC